MTSRSRKSAAFTVIELLVAVAITVVLAGLLIAVTRSALNLWQNTQDSSTANVQAKVALDFLVRDLQAAIYREAGESTLAIDIVGIGNLSAHEWRQDYLGANKPDTVSILTPSTDATGRYLESSRFGRGGVWLRFLTTNQRTGGGAPAMVGYQISRRPISGPTAATNPPAVRYTLSRMFLDGDDTFAGGYVAANHDSALTSPGTDDALCDNVVDFGVWCYRRNTDGTLDTIYPSGAQDRDFRGAGNQFPDVVDVMLRVLTDSGATELEQMEAGLVQRPTLYATDADWWWAVVEAQSRIYSARVVMIGGNGT
jgi:type II secretory pathway pseudopilin PulG